MTITITAEHVGRTARTLLAGTNHGGTTEIATGAVVEIERVDLPLSYLDASEPGRARVLVRSVRHGAVCTMDARHLQLLTETVGPRPAVDREALAQAAHRHYCTSPNAGTHELDIYDFDKADYILEVLALIGGDAK